MNPWLHRLVKFNQVDVTTRVDEASKGLGKDIASCREVLDQKTCPDVSTGSQCDKPYKCRMFSVCNSGLIDAGVK